MGIVERVKNICLTPKTEWPVIEQEATDAKTLYTTYIMLLALIPAIATLISLSVMGGFMGHFGLGFALSTAVVGYVMSLIMVFVIALIANALAPSFDGQKDMTQALKLTAYAMTTSWLAGAFSIIPALGWLIALLGALYSIYLFYAGVPVVMKVPEQKSAGYTVVIVIAAIIAGLVLGLINSMVVGMGTLGGFATMHGSRTTPNVTFDKDSPMAKIEEFSKKMESAQQSGDPEAQMTAVVEGLGTLLGGGRRVDPVDIEQLKPFVPEEFAGLERTSNKTEKTGVAGVMVSRAEARYGDGGGRNVVLEITDTGGASGILGLASWAGVQGEKEDQYGAERTRNVDGRLVREKTSRVGGDNEFAVVLGKRFIVSAKGNVELDTLKQAVSSLDLGRLEAMKDVGVQE